MSACRPPAAPAAVLVLRPGAIGDTILTLPALAALRRARPGARLVLVGNALLAPLLVGGPVDALESFDAPWVGRLFEPPGQPAAELAERVAGVGLAVVWLRESGGPVAASLRALGIPTLAAPSLPPAGERRHVADHLLATLRPLGEGFAGAADGAALCLAPPAAGAAWAGALWRRAGLSGPAPCVAIHPGSGGARKNWPAERFAAVADRLARRGCAVLLLGGPADERPAAALRRSVRVARPVVVAAPDLAALAGVLVRCAAYLGNDSGVTHLAAALGVPTVALFGPTDPAVWGPRGERVTRLWRAPECLGWGRCGPAGRDCADRRCLELLSVEEVAAAVEERLA